MHGKGRCSFTRHGTYVRKTACDEAHVARSQCLDSQVTFSLLTDCLASGLPDSLADLGGSGGGMRSTRACGS